MASLYEKVCGCISHGGFLTRAGYRGVDKAAQRRYLDTMDSVSGSRRDETQLIFDEDIIDEQHRRYLNALEVR